MTSRLKNQLNIFKENTVDCISEEELRAKLQEALEKERPLKIKIGFDPTARDIHLGHTVLLRKLRTIQDLGHRVCLIIGDFTAQIGDPSGRNELRPTLSRHEIEDNARTYTSQAFKILDEKKTDIIFNSQWYKDLSLSDFLPLLSRYTVARILERDDFSKRLKEGNPLSLLEIIYPLIQGYDSVCLEADIEFGGTDQKFNLIVGRHLQESYGQKPQVVMTMPLLVGLDGKNKMSKSLGNYVGITDPAGEMFGKLMSISDELMWEYYRLLTDIDRGPLKNFHPKEAKLRLAQELVSCYHSPECARQERETFEKVFSHRELPEDMPVYESPTDTVDIIEVLCQNNLVDSRNEARRLLQQKGITERGSIIEERTLVIPPEGLLLKVGKRRFLKIVKK